MPKKWYREIKLNQKGGAGEIRTHDRRVSPNNCLYSFLVSIYQCSNGSSLSCPVGKDSVDPLFIIYPLEPIAMPG